MATLQELLIEIGVDAKGVESGADRATRAVRGAFDDMTADAEKLGVTLEGIGATAGVATGAALGAGITSALDIGTANAKLTAQLGLTEAEAERAGEVAGTVFGAGFGESIGEVNTALQGVHTNIGDLSGFTNSELDEMTTSALTLATTFDEDVSQATIAAGQLMKTGLAKDATEAFDILASGFQDGANRSGDLLDTITEYGTQFRNMGLTGSQATGLLSQGLQAGARDADTVADALKEFSIEAVAGSDKIGEAWSAMGLDADAMFAKIAEGGPSAAEALDLTLDTLREVEDPLERNALATELFGTKAEDLGAALFALDPSAAALDNVTGAAQGMSDTLAEDPAQVFSGSVRQLTGDLAAGLAPALSTVAGFVSQNQGSIAGLAATILGIAAAVTAATVALKIYQTIMLAIRVATLVWTAVQWLLNAALWANPITWIIVGIIALIAIIILVIVYWDEIVAAVLRAWEWIKQATGAAVDWLVGFISEGLAWLLDLFMKWHPVGIIISHWDDIVAAFEAGVDWSVDLVMGLVDKVLGWLAKLAQIPGMVGGFFGRMHQAAVAKVAALLGYVRTIPQRVKSGLGNLGNLLRGAGRNIIQGLINGIRSMIGSVGSAMSNIAGRIRAYLPFSPAEMGPLSGGGAPEVSGARIAETLGEGVLSELAYIDRIADQLMAPLDSRMDAMATTAPAVPSLPASSSAAAQRFAGDDQRLVLDVTGADEDMKRLIRKMVRVDGRGDVQTAFGR